MMNMYQAAVLLADQPTTGSGAVHVARRRAVAELQHRGRARLDAHLVLDADAQTSLRAPRLPSALTFELGHDEQRMPFTPSGASVSAREHQMDDVLGHVVLAVGDEDLGAEDLEAAVGCGSARERTSARSLPACGSVRFMVPVQAPSIILGMNAVCARASWR